LASSPLPFCTAGDAVTCKTIKKHNRQVCLVQIRSRIFPFFEICEPLSSFFFLACCSFFLLVIDLAVALSSVAAEAALEMGKAVRLTGSMWSAGRSWLEVEVVGPWPAAVVRYAR
jgi:hypothetical protein